MMMMMMIIIIIIIIIIMQKSTRRCEYWFFVDDVPCTVKMSSCIIQNALVVKVREILATLAASV